MNYWERLQTLNQRIGKKIQMDSETGCWDWMGALNREGYGQTGYYLGNGKSISCRAHILIFRLLKSGYPAGLQLDHLCRNRRCVNPDHLEPVTAKENVNRGRSANREKTHCKRGHEFTPENTFIEKAGWRNCKTCILLRPIERKKKAAKSMLGVPKESTT